jgi:hypothetical protein
VYFLFLYEYVLKDISLGCVFNGLSVSYYRDFHKNPYSSSCKASVFDEFKQKLECSSVFQKIFLK